jgi:hypothetical protein
MRYIYIALIFFCLGVCAILFTNPPKTITIIKPVTTTVTSNVYIPEYRTKYITKTVTVNNNIVSYITINSSNAEELANKFQEDLLHFENDPLNITIDEYVVGQKNISASANLHYRYWKLNIHNNYKITETVPLINFNVLYNIRNREIEFSVSKELFNFGNVPIGIGVSI